MDILFSWGWLNDAIAGKVQLISRTGTGQNTSSSSPVTLSFSFAPVVVMHVGDYSGTLQSGMYGTLHLYSFLKCTDITTTFSKVGNFNEFTAHFDGNFIKKSSDGKTLYYYCSYSSYEKSFNSTVQYQFLGIG